MLITDPWFYLTAIPAVIIIGISKAGFGSAFGSLAVPLMALTITVPQATAILLPSLLVMDALGLRAYWRQADWTMLQRILPTGLLGILLGWALFNSIQPKVVGGIVGVTAIGFVGLRAWQAQQAKKLGERAPFVAPGWVAWLCSAASGFTSFVAHAGGPPLAIYTLPQKLNPVVFTATMTVFFAVINVSKLVPYATLGLLSLENMATAMVLVFFAPIGNWIGLNIAKTIKVALFYRTVTTALFLSGSKLIYDALQ